MKLVRTALPLFLVTIPSLLVAADDDPPATFQECFSYSFDSTGHAEYLPTGEIDTENSYNPWSVSNCEDISISGATGSGFDVTGSGRWFFGLKTKWVFVDVDAEFGSLYSFHAETVTMGGYDGTFGPEYSFRATDQSICQDIPEMASGSVPNDVINDWVKDQGLIKPCSDYVNPNCTVQVIEPAEIAWVDGRSSVIVSKANKQVLFPAIDVFVGTMGINCPDGTSPGDGDPSDPGDGGGDGGGDGDGDGGGDGGGDGPPGDGPPGDGPPDDGGPDDPPDDGGPDDPPGDGPPDNDDPDPEPGPPGPKPGEPVPGDPENPGVGWLIPQIIGNGSSLGDKGLYFAFYEPITKRTIENYGDQGFDWESNGLKHGTTEAFDKRSVGWAIHHMRIPKEIVKHFVIVRQGMPIDSNLVNWEFITEVRNKVSLNMADNSIRGYSHLHYYNVNTGQFTNNINIFTNGDITVSDEPDWRIEIMPSNAKFAVNFTAGNHLIAKSNGSSNEGKPSYPDVVFTHNNFDHPMTQQIYSEAISMVTSGESVNFAYPNNRGFLAIPLKGEIEYEPQLPGEPPVEGDEGTSGTLGERLRGDVKTSGTISADDLKTSFSEAFGVGLEAYKGVAQGLIESTGLESSTVALVEAIQKGYTRANPNDDDFWVINLPMIGEDIEIDTRKFIPGAPGFFLASPVIYGWSQWISGLLILSWGFRRGYNLILGILYQAPSVGNTINKIGDTNE